jgi:hypothetical protein
MRLCKRFFPGFQTLAIEEENWLATGDAVRDSADEIRRCKRFFS